MKNSFLKFLLVPHDKGESRWIKFPVIFLILILILISLSVFFFWNNLQRYIDISSVVFIKTDNERLREKISMLEKEKKELKSGIDSLLKKQKRILDEHDIFFTDSQKRINLQPDSMLLVSGWVEAVMEKSLSARDSFLRGLPSILPVSGRIIREFGSKIDPYTGKEKPHKGIDILAPLNSNVVATGAGVVKEVGHDLGRGLFVEVQHPGGYITTYNHLLSVIVKDGDILNRGDLIGYVGQSGRAPHPYLYYEVKRDTLYMNPENFIYQEL